MTMVPILSQAARTIEQLVCRMQEEVAVTFEIPVAETRCAGVLASVLTPLDDESGGAVEISFDYTNPHVDKANRVAYDYSSVLYLNSSEVDFAGGAFVFLDDEEQPLSDFDDSESAGGDVTRQVVLPRIGRLVMFTSGVENVHHVEPVRALQPNRVMDVPNAIQDGGAASPEETPRPPLPTCGRGFNFSWLTGSDGLAGDLDGEHRRVTLSSWWTHSNGSVDSLPIEQN